MMPNQPKEPTIQQLFNILTVSQLTIVIERLEAYDAELDAEIQAIEETTTSEQTKFGSLLPGYQIEAATVEVMLASANRILKDKQGIE